MAPLWAMMRPSISNGCVFCGRSAPVEASRTCTTNVVELMCCTSRENAASSKAATGSLSSTGVPSGS